MHRSSSLTWQITALTLLALGFGLLLLPADFSEAIRRILRDGARPGQTVTVAVADYCQSVWQTVCEWQARRQELEQLKHELSSERERGRQFQIELAQTRQELQQAHRKNQERLSASSSAALFVPELVDARVVGHEVQALHQGRKILGAGSSGGLGENLLVLDPLRPTLDVGKDLGVTIHAPVYSGQAVIGRTINCGAYSCSLQSVTDAQFNGAAQIMRRTVSGLQPGPEGVVEGTGKRHCRLTGIWRSESIEEGDEIYTPADNPWLPYQMFYGKVIRAHLPEGAAHWVIELEPAANTVQLNHVQILKSRENSIRVASGSAG